MDEKQDVVAVTRGDEYPAGSVGALVAEMGENAAYSLIVAQSIEVRSAAWRAVDEIRADHYSDDGGRSCRICGPQDGTWPCIARMAADDLAFSMPLNDDRSQP